MKKLATSYWAPANGTRKGVRCRIEWIANQCKNYFFEGGREHFEEREAIIKSKSSDAPPLKRANSNPKVELLDVGSCYNPFRDLDAFEVTAIDLAPSVDTVLQCDFLGVPVAGQRQLSPDDARLVQLAASCYDVVVFSLFLEYLPCPAQRFLACEKARDVLKPSGILVIATPDSKHVGANAKFMRSWRLVLSDLGFARIKYEKLPHVHCLVFRKCFDPEVARRWRNMQRMNDVLGAVGEIFIPQDFQVAAEKSGGVEGEGPRDEEGMVGLFGELPYEDE